MLNYASLATLTPPPVDNMVHVFTIMNANTPQITLETLQMTRKSQPRESGSELCF